MTLEVQDIMGRIFKAGTLTLALCLILYPFYIKYLKWRSFGQQIREDGPEAHYAKKDTPTMGGLPLVAISLIAAALFVGQKLTYHFVVFIIIVLAAMVLGMIDDLSKIARRVSLGLRAREKLIIQIILAVILVLYILNYSGIEVKTRFPMLGVVDSQVLFVVLGVLVMVGTINAVNLTDGLDGLASGLCALGFLAYMVICYKNEQFDLAIASFALCCACVAFLWYNAYPAKIFMGDTGSLALGAALATLALLSRTEFLLFIIGGIFVAETLSVILQIVYFKLTGGKRLFKMAPLHHHFEKKGWHEVEVTIRFWIISLTLSVVGLIIYFREFLMHIV